MHPPPVAPPALRLAQGVRLLAWMLLLSTLLSFNLWWPTPMVVPDHRVSPEFVLLWCALLGWVAWRGALPAWALTVLALLYTLMVLGRYADVGVPALFGRPVNLYWDGLQIPRFVWVSAQALPWWASAAAVLGVTGALWGLYRLVRRALQVLVHEAAPRALRSRVALAASGFFALSALGNYAGVQATWPYISKPVLPGWVHQAGLVRDALSPERVADALPASTVIDQAMAGHSAGALALLGGRDLYLIMLESVGAITYDDAGMAATLAPRRRAFEQELQAAGKGVVSAFVKSPTFAGGSDLAHLGLLSGMDLSVPRRHDLLLTTQRPTLISLMRAQGYQTFGVYHAVFWDWPERAFYNYDTYVDARQLDYRGPALGSWVIPDQFAFARFEQLHPRSAGGKPRFVFFPTISSHLPFSPVPPYQPDWMRILGNEPFDGAEVARLQAQKTDWLNMRPGYIGMVDYTYRWLGGYLAQPFARDGLHVLVGDHQPASNVTGEGASWDVPVHVVSNDPQLLQRFEALGFVRGMEPPRAALGGMHELTGLLLRALSAPPLLAGAVTQAPSAAAARTPPQAGAHHATR